ncbi:hypothetical protein, conserved in T. vivax [Trypanosoma vivax Y486]|uniref:Uncharacterized protein n=1 Tax=Trypanosoma vivax (strain Y486) TaxID=1055687 RepID=F9WU18_TRYVY|nr:hypothetical protein, conserved in T. vivax [Trypanosoma vivax Y486]|eukprot:CCD21064.1 hypothetical protein, conserved in T. vivax [Trypanosoma vivax Y486]
MRVNVACFSLPVASPSSPSPGAHARVAVCLCVRSAFMFVPHRPFLSRHAAARTSPTVVASRRGAATSAVSAARPCVLVSSAKPLPVSVRAPGVASLSLSSALGAGNSAPLFAAPLFCVLCSLVVHFAIHASKANALHASRKATSFSVFVPCDSWPRQFAAACVLLLALMAAASSFSVLSVSAMSACAAQLSKCSAIFPGGVELDVLSVVSFGDLPHSAPCRGHVVVCRACAVEHRGAGVPPSEKRAVPLRASRV